MTAKCIWWVALSDCCRLSGVMRSWFSFLRTNSVRFLFHKPPEIAHSRAGFISVQRCLFQSTVVWRVCVCRSCVVCLGENWFIYTSLVAVIGMSLWFVLLDLFLHFWDFIFYVKVNSQSPTKVLLWAVIFLSVQEAVANQLPSLFAVLWRHNNMVQLPERC